MQQTRLRHAAVAYIGAGGGRGVASKPPATTPPGPKTPPKPPPKTLWGKIGDGISTGVKRAIWDPAVAAVETVAEGWTSVYDNSSAVIAGEMSLLDAAGDMAKTLGTNYLAVIVSPVVAVVDTYAGFADTISHIANGDYEKAAASYTESTIGAVSIASGARLGVKPRPRKTGCLNSFVATTLVLLANGSRRAIADIKIGDVVLAADSESGEVEGKPVTAIHNNKDLDLTDLTVQQADGTLTTLHTTHHHPFWSETRNGWVDAAELQEGEVLSSLDGREATVRVVHNYSGTEYMRDLTVAGFHTYYVLAGETPVLVHNSGGDRFRRLSRTGYSNYVLVDSRDRVYYSGMFGPGDTAAGVQYRHAKNNNRFNPENGDTIRVMPGTRTYGESRLMEQRLADHYGTVIGRDGSNYRGNRQNPIAGAKRGECEAFERRLAGGC